MKTNQQNDDFMNNITIIINHKKDLDELTHFLFNVQLTTVDSSAARERETAIESVWNCVYEGERERVRKCMRLCVCLRERVCESAR